MASFASLDVEHTAKVFPSPKAADPSVEHDPRSPRENNNNSSDSESRNQCVFGDLAEIKRLVPSPFVEAANISFVQVIIM